MRKLNSTHYRLLRIAERDWKNKIPRSTLDELGRARPSLWAKYITASTVIKILRDQAPIRLHDHLVQTIYSERRNPGVWKFYDSSRVRIGKHAIGNRLKEIFDEINEPITFKETDGMLRTKLKRLLGMVPNEAKPKPDVVQEEESPTVEGPAVVWRREDGALLL